MNSALSTTSVQKPVVLVTGCNRMMGKHLFHMAGKKYIDAVRLADCTPLIVPWLAPNEIDSTLDLADGVLLTGSASNVHPGQFGETVLDESLPLDPARDDWTLPLIPRVLARGIPMFGICRGFQETNVALGGTLHQALQDVPGQNDHREPSDESLDVQYGPSHEVTVVPGGALAGIVEANRFMVNSLHGQGINRLAPGLRVEALALDGLVEAFSIPTATAFNLCVQWHPEWQTALNPNSLQLMKAFGAACQSFRDRHRQSQRTPDR